MSPQDRCLRIASGTSRCDGRHDERAVRVGRRAAGDDLVPAERQVVGKRERRAAHQAPVDRPRVHRDVRLRHLSATPADLGVQLDPHLDRVAVLDVHGDVRVPALADDEHRRQHAAPRHVLDVRDRQVDPLRRRRVDPERTEHALQRRGAGTAVLAVEVPVVGHHPVGRGEA